MTRLIFLPALLCLPLLSNAQTNVTKEASLSLPAEASYGTLPLTASPTSTPSSAAAPNPVRPVSTGIVPPKLVRTLALKDDGNQHVHVEGRQRVVIVELTVNTAGEPTDLHIPSPTDDSLDVEVLATVGKFRYQPGTLNGKPIAMPVRMHYIVPVGAIY